MRSKVRVKQQPASRNDFIIAQLVMQKHARDLLLKDQFPAFLLLPGS